MTAHLRYLRYIVAHKWFVFVAGLQTGAPLWRLLIHDWSKFLPCEWFPYVEFFYGPKMADRDDYRRRESNVLGYPITKKPDDVEAAFDRAWLHHQHANPHHWQHWLLREDSGGTKTLPMPEKVVREMVADWMGAGRAITGRWDVATWYAKNAHVIQLHPETRAKVEALIPAAHAEAAA
jgi:hypothetical protein